ncbi:hypothetical protein [Paraburkholderia sp. BR10882]|uniref:hypothetical protein n=1 Tax=unclassified Paraburkholderia TaxID=2615204 RepID=UPI0034CDB650
MLDADAAARAQGVVDGMRRGGVLTLAPNANLRQRELTREEQTELDLLAQGTCLLFQATGRLRVSVEEFHAILQANAKTHSPAGTLWTTRPRLASTSPRRTITKS